MHIIGTVVPERCYAIEALPARKEAAQLWAGSGEGRTFIGRDYLTNVRGNKSIVYLPIDKVPACLHARNIVKELTEWDDSRIGFHFAQLARNCVEWLDFPPNPMTDPADFIGVWHYQLCEPILLDEGTIYDMNASYWQVAGRAKSPLLTVDKTRSIVNWQGLSAEREDRWERLKVAALASKPLRLAIIGVNSSGYRQNNHRGRVRFYYRGEERYQEFPTGPLQSLAMLTVRTAYELTQLASIETQSIYSNADSIGVIGRIRPKIWDDLGIDYGIRAQGDTEIMSVGAWKCGDKETLHYTHRHELETRLGVPLYVPHDPVNVARPVYWEQVYQQ